MPNGHFTLFFARSLFSTWPLCNHLWPQSLQKVWRYVEIDCKVVWGFEVWWWCKSCISRFWTQVNPCQRTSACLQQNRVVEFGIFVITVISGFKPCYWNLWMPWRNWGNVAPPTLIIFCHTLERGERWKTERDQRISQLCKERWNLELRVSSHFGLQQF